MPEDKFVRRWTVEVGLVEEDEKEGVSLFFVKPPISIAAEYLAYISSYLSVATTGEDKAGGSIMMVPVSILLEVLIIFCFGLYRCVGVPIAILGWSMSCYQL